MKKEGSSLKSVKEYFGEEHDILRRSMREFVGREITPYIEEWEEKGEFPRDLYKRMAELGYLGIGFPEEFGGTPGDIFLKIVMTEELMRCGSAGLVAGIGSLDIAVPPIVRKGTPQQKERYVKPVLAGEKIAALAITEPGGGSDVANLKARAVRDGDHYIVNGSKTFITSGVRADHITCAVRTGDEGAHGISFLIIESKTPGYSVGKKLRKMGWWASDTAELFFDDCKVPAENLLGKENRGFYIIMENFQTERLWLSIMANMTAQLALEESIRYVKERTAFGKKLKGFQVIRHKRVDMATLVEASREFAYRVASKIDAGVDQVKEVSMLKNFACSVSDKVTYDAVQIFGGYGYMREYLVERLYRDNRILSIGGGTSEIMKEIISNLIL